MRAPEPLQHLGEARAGLEELASDMPRRGWLRSAVATTAPGVTAVARLISAITRWARRVTSARRLAGVQGLGSAVLVERPLTPGRSTVGASQRSLKARDLAELNVEPPVAAPEHARRLEQAARVSPFASRRR